MKNLFFVLAMVFGVSNFSFATEEAFPNLRANPSFYDFGSVRAGQTRMMTVTFMNFSKDPIPYLNVNCMGDYSVFQCFSMCTSLPANGSCSVQVQFHARNGDGQRKMLTIQASGGGAFATSSLSGTDAK